MNVLFIGGPLDGEFIGFDIEPRGLPPVFVAATEEAVHSVTAEVMDRAEQGVIPDLPGVTAYKLAILATGVRQEGDTDPTALRVTRPIPVYAVDGVNVIAALISGYRARDFDA